VPAVAAGDHQDEVVRARHDRHQHLGVRLVERRDDAEIRDLDPVGEQGAGDEGGQGHAGRAGVAPERDARGERAPLEQLDEAAHGAGHDRVRQFHTRTAAQTGVGGDQPHLAA
jgi:hypothetical protein